MKLRKILEGTDYKLIKGSIDIEINKIQYDSRKVQQGDIFFCIEGYKVDGHDYIKDAIDRGASVIVCQKDIEILEQCTVIKYENTRKALSLCSANFYDNPSNKMKIIGITGTNGKTTSTYMIKSILEKAGYKVGLVGTIANYIGKNRVTAKRTTPESLELQQLFKEMVDEEVEYCIMEVSSHSLSLNRVYGIKFSQGLFTNLTQDHLDFHKTFDEYFKAKFKLFENSENSIVNIDDKYGEKIYRLLGGEAQTYSLNNKSDLQAEDIGLHSRGAEFYIRHNEEKIKLGVNIPGKYNVYNALGSLAVCLNEGIDMTYVVNGLKEVTVPGRCEIVTRNYKLGFDVIIDYAHTPDGLENILKTAREFTKKRLISVFGCGGDRDRTKRPIMGDIGSSISDVAVITSDNPRTEEPISIIHDILKGVKGDNYVVVENRREAIKKAIYIAEKGDVIVVAGKGHEDYQILKDKTIHFDEREVVEDIIKELF
jgi:UDP-N-acetylmuramoyl-L-alanyl-D-glutamate--2,6-diaminopimelate ligase